MRAQAISSASYFDSRLVWQCACEPGFGGADCAHAIELHCDNGLDDDSDGLTDCDDDDCCAHAACRDHLMCLKSPEPSAALAAYNGRNVRGEQSTWTSSSSSSSAPPDDATPLPHAWRQWRFLIANESVQSYAQERAFDKQRVGIVRGKVVVKWTSRQQHHEQQQVESVRGVVNVRVGVLECAQCGFTLTRDDGHFDMLVNANEWLTLQFHRNAYAPLKRKVFARASQITLLDEHVELEPASASSPVSWHAAAQHSTFQLDASAHKNLSANSAAAAAECLMTLSMSARGFAYEPVIIQRHGGGGGGSVRAFALASAGAFRTQLHARSLRLQLNTAHNKLARDTVKPSVVIRLLPSDYNSTQAAATLRAVHLRLSIEGQAWRELMLEPVAQLSYHFAWNRRNVYGQKVYGFSELRVHVGYEYGGSSGAPCRIVWHERVVYVEAHQLDAHADVGAWQPADLHRLDVHRNALYAVSAGWTLPFTLAYPPIVSTARPFATPTAPRVDSNASHNRLLARGPNSSMFVVASSGPQPRLVQLDSSGQRVLIQVPLAILTSKFAQQQQQPPPQDVQIIYNNYLSMLYLSSRSAAKIIQVSLSSLQVLNKSLSGHTATLAADDDIDIEPLCGFGHAQLSAQTPHRPARAVRLDAPHSMTLDENNQILYLLDGPARIVALSLASQQATLLTSFAGSRAVWSPPPPPAAAAERCDSTLPADKFRPTHELRALTWDKSSSSLVFVDANIVYRLRQDMRVQMLAAGAMSHAELQRLASNNNGWPAMACVASKLAPLGRIKLIVADDTEADLMLLHSWTHEATMAARDNQAPGKLVGRNYLAKLVHPREFLGDTDKLSSHKQAVVDLHSLATWRATLNAATQHNNDNNDDVTSSASFLTSSNGFARADSAEINLDGSIFVLDQDDHSISIVRAFAPAERVDTHAYSSSSSLSSSIADWHNERVLSVQNPIARNILHFHATSGLQLGATHPKHQIKLHYQSHRMHQIAPADSDNEAELFGPTFDLVRLTRIVNTSLADSTLTSEYSFVSHNTGSRVSLQAILQDGQPIAELATDRQGALSKFKPIDSSQDDTWTELIYDPTTGLLRDLITRSRISDSWTQLQRVVYDRLFFHYCDLFVINA